MKIQKIGIAGAGLMGTSMAQIFAKYGYDVVIYDAFPAALDKGRILAKTNQQAAVDAGEITPEAAQAVTELAQAVGKKTTLCRKDVPGFIANRLPYALLREAMWLLENGVAEVEDVDACIKYGLGFYDYAGRDPISERDQKYMAIYKALYR